MVALPEATDLRANCGDRSRAVRTQHIGEGRRGAEHFGEFAFALVWIPDPHARGFDPEKHFIRPGLGHRELFHMDVLDAAETVEGGSTHG